MKKLYCLTTGLILTCFVFGQKSIQNNPKAELKSRASVQIPGNLSQGQGPVVFSFPGNVVSPTAVYSQDFEGVTPPALPAGITTGGATGSDFFKTGTNVQANAGGYWPVPAHTKFVMTNDDVCNCDKSADFLELPQQNFTGKTGMTLAYSTFNDGKYAINAIATVDINVNNAGWVSIDTIPEVVGAWQNLSLPLPSSTDNQANVKIRFFWNDGSPTTDPNDSWGTGLAIDDIIIDVPAAINIEMTSKLTYTDVAQSSYYAKIPLTQAGAMSYAGEIKNKGTQTAPNAKLNVVVTKGTSVFNNTSTAASINVGDSGTYMLTQTFSPTDTGTYTVTYTASCDSTDAYPIDNTQSLSFKVTDTIFARDNDAAAYQLTASAFTGIAPVTTSYEFGNYFETSGNDTASSISFEIGPTSDVGTTVQGNIYDSSGTLVGQTDFYTISAGDIGTFPAFKTVTLMLQPPAVELTPNNFYIVTLADLSTTDSATGIICTTNNSAGWTPGVMMVDGITNLYNISYYPFVRLNTKAAFNPCAATLSAANTNVTCNGASTGAINLSVSGGTSPFTFTWSNGATTEDLSNIMAGSYTVTVSMGGGCSPVTGTYQITQPANPLTATVAATGTCSGSTNGTATANPVGGTSPYSYLWSNSQTGKTANNLAAGSYNVTVTDSKGCTTTGTATVTAVTITVTATSTNTSCGLNNGSALAAGTGGTTPYSYLWSNAQTTASISGLAPGSYTVTVTDSKGCNSTGSANIGTSTPVVVSTSSVNAACGMTDGSATVVAPTGTSFSYLWSNGQTTVQATGLGAGTYSVTVTNSVGGCSGSGVASVNNTGAATIALTKTDVNCNGDSTGSVDITVTGGATPYTFLWSNGATTEDVTGLDAGNYMVTVSGNDGCKSSASTLLNEPIAISANAVATGVTCNGGTNGSVNLLASGGNSPFTFMWSNSATTEDLSNVGAGTYTVTITDANACKKMVSASVTQPSAIALTTVVTNATGNTGAVNLTATGGTTPYSYLWSNSATTEDISGLAAGTYSVTVTDANGCTNDTSATVIAVGISEEVFSSGFSIFPNPTMGTINLQFNNAKGLNNIVIRNLVGQVLYNERGIFTGNSIKQIDCSNFGQGIYFLTVIGKDMNSTRKIIVK